MNSPFWSFNEHNVWSKTLYQKLQNTQENAVSDSKQGVSTSNIHFVKLLPK